MQPQSHNLVPGRGGWHNTHMNVSVNVLGIRTALAIGGGITLALAGLAALAGVPGPGAWAGVAIWALFCGWTAYAILNSGRLNPHRFRLFLLLAAGTLLAVFASNSPQVIEWKPQDSSTLGPALPVCHIALAATLGNLAVNLARALVSPEGLGWAFYYLLAGAYLAFTLLLGTGWCSWACGYGAWDEAASRPGAARTRWRLPGSPRTWLAFSGAVLLTLVLVAHWQREAVFCQWLCPFKLTEDLGGEAVAWVRRVKWGAAAGVGVAFILLLPMLTGKRTFCLLVCPFGAWQRWAGRWHPFRVRCASDRCTVCGRCVRVCPFGALELAGEARVSVAASCTHCGRCVDACPEGALSIGFGRAGASGRSVRVIFVLTAVLLAGVVGLAVWTRAGMRIWSGWGSA